MNFILSAEFPFPFLSTTTPESSNNNSTINASYYNRTGHLISPIGNEELINIATASPSVITTTTTSSSIPTTESTVASLSPYVNIDKFNSPCDDVIQCITTTVPVKTNCSTVVELPSSSSSIITNKSSTTGVAITAIANTTTFYSPWRHRSVLNQALGGGVGDDDDGGGGNSSPEWSSFSIPNDNKLHEMSIIQQGQLEYNHDNSDNNLCEDFSNHNNKEEYESTTRKIKENSIHKTTNHSELDLLVNMLDRVEMKDDTMQENDKSTIVTQIIRDCNLAMNESKCIFQEQLEKQLGSHVCAAHPEAAWNDIRKAMETAVISASTVNHKVKEKHWISTASTALIDARKLIPSGSEHNEERSQLRRKLTRRLRHDRKQW
ncbi:unnamed protein product [Schistosoma mattheei]|uniref:Uncharacterized protein n=1 Tax=Schistosoma mattheei TaxID=31246 RepID=A0A183NJQ9_9TREM|nr:unnamed protein product [Schistosoma mattheei]